ncbi:hypothetical protein [Plantibacter sp. ME-Dv--P-122b]|uniref:hypothetical protein n=1 Tax=Plantibacter sp. ME-Dv--P-122b TaxID=3040300 RepID=UPI00254FBB49|nr:hypothetical protein [Plantibacter sp. ME-Dv--P-122b]
MPEVERACHYTSTQGLISILQNHALRASSAAFMNDANEMRSGARAFRTAFEARRAGLQSDEHTHVEHSGLMNEETAFSNFLLSAARDPDSLTLWRNYGVSEVAYSIELDGSQSLVPLVARSGESHPSPPPDFYAPDEVAEDGTPIHYFPADATFVLGGSWRDVDYIEGVDDPLIGKRLDELIARYRKNRDAGKLIVTGYANAPIDFMKDRGFSDEREVRCVFTVNPWWKFVRYRPTRFGIVPYIELTGGGGKMEEEWGSRGSWAMTPQPLPVKRVTIGPNAPHEAERALRSLLDQTGYGSASVARSETPYR